MATAALIGRPSPAARSSEAVAYKGNLERAAQIASVASSHDPVVTIGIRPSRGIPGLRSRQLLRCGR
jgi:hypothetical protein